MAFTADREGKLTYRTWMIPGSAESFLTEKREDLSCQIRRNEAGGLASVYYTEIDAEGGLTENTLEFLPAPADPIPESSPEPLPGTGIRLTRSGALSAEFTFLPGRSSLTTMVTPYGTIRLTVETSEIIIHNDPHQIRIALHYSFSEAPDEAHKVEYIIQFEGD